MKRWWLTLLSVFWISGCVGYGGTLNEAVFAVYPPTQAPGYGSVFVTDESYSPPVIDSLRPTLRWSPIDEPIETDKYDIVIHETYPNSPLRWAIGPEVYYRQGLQALEHTLEIQLKSSQAYYWAVRIRRGEKPASKWSSFIFLRGCTFMGSGCTAEDLPFFLFVTPDK